jgi:L-rhamnose mutarotase
MIWRDTVNNYKCYIKDPDNNVYGVIDIDKDKELIRYQDVLTKKEHIVTHFILSRLVLYHNREGWDISTTPFHINL